MQNINDRQINKLTPTKPSMCGYVLHATHYIGDLSIA